MKGRARLALSCALLLGAFVFLQLRSTGEAIPIRKSLTTFPTTIGDWRLQSVNPLDEGTLNVLKVKDYATRTYVDPAGRSLNLYIGYWETQRKGAQIHSPKNCLPGAGWEPVESSRTTITLPSPYAPITVNQLLIQKDRERLAVLYWYQSRGKVCAGEVDARIQMIKSSILHNRSDGAIVEVSSPVRGNAEETYRGLVRYVQAMYPALSEYLPE